MGTERTVVVVTGGDPLDGAIASLLPPTVAVVAADSGADHAAAIGLHVDLAVGDFDSVSPATLDRLTDAGATIERHPEAKDATDLELGLAAARRFDPTHVIVLGGHGGRVDHFIANALLLAAPAYADLRVTAMVGPARLAVVHDHVELGGQPGDIVTLLPVAGAAAGVRTRGLLYPLRGEVLAPGTTRGVSNELVEERATVALDRGVLLVVQPGVGGTHLRTGTSARARGGDQPPKGP